VATCHQERLALFAFLLKRTVTSIDDIEPHEWKVMYRAVFEHGRPREGIIGQLFHAVNVWRESIGQLRLWNF